MDQPFRRYGLFSSSVPRKIYLSIMTLLVLVFHRICSTNCVTLGLQFQRSQLAPFFSENFCCLQKNQKNVKSSQNCRGGPILQFIRIVARSVFYADSKNCTHFASFSILPWRFMPPPLLTAQSEKIKKVPWTWYGENFKGSSINWGHRLTDHTEWHVKNEINSVCLQVCVSMCVCLCFFPTFCVREFSILS